MPRLKFVVKNYVIKKIKSQKIYVKKIILRRGNIRIFEDFQKELYRDLFGIKEF